MHQQGRRAVWLAEHLGLSRSRLSHIMKGRRLMNGPEAERAAELLGVPFSLLFVLSDGSDMDTDGSTQEAA